MALSGSATAIPCAMLSTRFIEAPPAGLDPQLCTPEPVRILLRLKQCRRWRCYGRPLYFAVGALRGARCNLLSLWLLGSSCSQCLFRPADTSPLPLSNSLAGVGGGEGGIRTHGTVARTPHFECGAFDHSATSPGDPPR